MYKLVYSKSSITIFCLNSLCAGDFLSAQNPIVPPGMYIADLEAHVWEDGRLYIYGSRDESPLLYNAYRHSMGVLNEFLCTK